MHPCPRRHVNLPPQETAFLSFKLGGILLIGQSAAMSGCFNNPQGIILGAELSLQTLTGMRVSHVWFSDHSICYLELGEIIRGRVRPNGSTGNPIGEVTIFLGYNWVVKGADAIICRKDIHKHENERENERDALAAKIVGATIESASLSECGDEIEICISTGHTLISVSSDAEGPDWSIGLNGYRDGSLNVQDGKLQFHAKKS